MDLEALTELVTARAERWRSAGATWELVRGDVTSKPASWVALMNGPALAQLTVWTSGEAELDWGDGETTGAAHYNLATRLDLDAALDVMEIEIGIA
ncbi:hypothetical protein [Nocardioides jejuensis]|uniref:hypothetical protein n=1 Tax=Nocardioides jejuensis TaxID=2502782 RepID=UPI001404E02A|nr:hypothetical protein [Nocardioides jejuensis]